MPGVHSLLAMSFPARLREQTYPALGFQQDNDLARRVLGNDAVECVAVKMIQFAPKPRRGFLPGFQLNAVNVISNW